MYAISFDLKISALKIFYGEPYNNAYFEISNILANYQFYRTQDSVYLTEINDMVNLIDAIDALTNELWFANSVRDIRAFRVEDWSNFTNRVKRKATNL